MLFLLVASWLLLVFVFWVSVVSLVSLVWFLWFGVVWFGRLVGRLVGRWVGVLVRWLLVVMVQTERRTRVCPGV